LNLEEDKPATLGDTKPLNGHSRKAGRMNSARDLEPGGSSASAALLARRSGGAGPAKSRARMAVQRILAQYRYASNGKKVGCSDLLDVVRRSAEKVAFRLPYGCLCCRQYFLASTMATSRSRIARLKKEQQFRRWLIFSHSLECLTDLQLEDLAIHWRDSLRVAKDEAWNS